MVLASIAKVRFDFGIPTLTSQRLRSLGERLMNEEEGYVEAEQVVLVADQFPTSLVASAIPGIEVVGVAVAGYVDEPMLAAIDALLPAPADDRRSKGDDSFPIVAGLGEAFVREANEYEIVLIDGNAGRVFVAPDAFVVSRFQSSTTRRRYFLEGAHVAAKTASDNRVVSVYCRASSREDIEAGMQAGADGVYLTPDNELFSTEAFLGASAQLQILHEMMDRAGGLPLLLDLPSAAVAYSALLEAAAGAPVSIAVDDLESGAELASALEMTRTFSDPDARLGEPKILLAPSAPGDASTLPDDLAHIDGILLREPWRAYDIEFIIPLISLARREGKPMIAWTTEDWRDEIEDIVRFGVDGMIVAPSETADVKDAIREL
jgi:hypothetical protein